MGPGDFEFHSAQSAIEQYAVNLKVHPPEPNLMPDLHWHRSWLPFLTSDASRLYVVCDRVDRFGTSPVRLVTLEWENYEVDRAISVEQVIRTWTWLLQEDLYRVERSGPTAWWEPVDWQRVPDFIRSSGLV